MSHAATLPAVCKNYLPYAPWLTRVICRGADVENIGQHLTRYALVLVLAWMGLLKFTAYEALAIQPMVAAHPLLSWLYDLFGVATVSGVIGTVEIAAAVLLVARPWSAVAGVAGAGIAIATLAVTSSFLVVLPPVWQDGIFPLLSVMPGQFLIKDLVLLGVAVWAFGHALKDVKIA